MQYFTWLDMDFLSLVESFVGLYFYMSLYSLFFLIESRLFQFFFFKSEGCLLTALRNLVLLFIISFSQFICAVMDELTKL